MTEKLPKWFTLSDDLFDPIHKRIAESINDHDLPVNLSLAPQNALWFFVCSLGIAYDANKEGMHAIAICQTRFCIETLSLIELGISRHNERERILEKWDKGKLSQGQLRKWLSENVWPNYGSGIWEESWEEFMGQLAKAVQPYAHYTSQLSQWQGRLHRMDPEDSTALVEFGPAVYDPQKATRITLYHSVLNYALARIWLSRFSYDDPKFDKQIRTLGNALGKSRYLDGNKTNWEQQFWAMTWDQSGSPILE